MPLDPDLVRCDLLKIKRKLFLSLPEGSEERKTFILATKMSELTYLTSLMPKDATDKLFHDYKQAVKFEWQSIIKDLLIGASFSIFFFCMHRVHSNDSFYRFWFVPSAIFSAIAAMHGWHLLSHWKAVTPFKKDYAAIKNRITQVIDEMNKLK